MANNNKKFSGRRYNNNNGRKDYSTDKNPKLWEDKRSVATKYSDAMKARPGKKFGKKGNQGSMTWKDDSKVATNNPEHYMSNPILVEAAARIPFTNPIGGQLRLFDRAFANSLGLDPTSYVQNNYSVPGIMVFETVPGFGTSRDANSAINVAAQAYYTLNRAKNSGSKNYDAPDIFTYYMGMSSLYSMINWAQRVFGVMRAFNPINKYLAQGLLKAMHVDYDDIAGNLVQYWGRLNLAINKIGSFAVPASMDYFAHVASMYLDIYSDGDNFKEQLYFYNPMGFYRYEFDTSSTPVHEEGFLKYYQMTTDDHLMTMNDIFSYIEDSIQAMLRMEDIAIMSGDTLKAFEGNIITMTEIAYDYRTLFKRDDFVLQQMKNSTIVGLYYTYPDLYQDSDKQYLLFEPIITRTFESAPTAVSLSTTFGIDGYRIMTVDGPNPDPKTVMELSRLMVAGTTEVDPENPLKYYMIPEVGADVVVRVAIFKFNYQDDGTEQYQRTWLNSFAISSSIEVCSVISPFRYAPMIILRSNSSDGAISHVHPFFDFDNYGVVSKEALAEIHRVAIYNMLATKGIAMI